MPKPNLKIVEPLAVAPQCAKAAPEAELTELFAREDALVRELRMIRTQLPAARERYARKHCLLILPSFETLRRLFA